MWEKRKAKKLPGSTVGVAGYEKPARQVFTPSAGRAFKFQTAEFNRWNATGLNLRLESKLNQGMDSQRRWPPPVTAKLPEGVDGV
jgi:hypothetical protein